MQPACNPKGRVTSSTSHKVPDAHDRLHLSKEGEQEGGHKQEYLIFTWNGEWNGSGRQMEEGNWVGDDAGVRT